MVKVAILGMNADRILMGAYVLFLDMLTLKTILRSSCALQQTYN